MRQMKVVLVDDEPIVLSDMQSLVDWNACGYTIVGAAYNAEQALELVRKHTPDLVFMDVALPGGMDGLKLSGMIKEIYRDIIIVILSGYMDFAYAQRAIDIGVFTYLVKHQLTPVTLEDLLEKVRRKIQRKESESSIVRRQLLKGLIDGGVRQDRLTLEQQEYLEPYRQPFYLMAYRPKRPYFEQHDQRFAFSSDITGLSAAEQPDHFTFSPVLANGCFLLTLVFFTQRTNLNMQTLHHSCDAIRQIVEHHTGMECMAAYLPSSASLSSMEKGCRILERELDRGIFCTDAVRAARILRTQSAANLEFLTKNAFLSDYEDTIEAVQIVMDEAVHARSVEAFDHCVQCVLDLLEDLGHNSIRSEVLREKLWTAQEVSRYLLETLERIHRHWQVRDAYSPSTIYVLEYISANYNQNPSINSVAKKLNSNPMYIGQKFKKETGNSFNDYLTRYRILLAQALLTETNLKINEVSRRVGISNGQYFSKIFQKATQLTPNEYRKRHFTINHREKGTEDEKDTHPRH